MAARPLPCHLAFLGCPGLAGLPAVPSWGGRPQGQRHLCRRDRGPPRGVPAGRTAAGRARARLCRWGSSLRPGPRRFCGVARRAALVRAAPRCFRKGGRLCLEGPAAPGSVVPRPSTQAGWGGQGSSVLRGRSCGSVLCAARPWPACSLSPSVLFSSLCLRLPGGLLGMRRSISELLSEAGVLQLLRAGNRGRRGIAEARRSSVDGGGW